MKSYSKNRLSWLIYAAVSLLTFTVGVVLIEARFRYAMSQPSPDDILEHFGDWILAVWEFFCILLPLLMVELEAFLVIRRRVILKEKPLGLERAFDIVSCSLAVLAMACGLFPVVCSLLALLVSWNTLGNDTVLLIVVIVGLCATLLWMLVRLTFAFSTVITKLVLRTRAQALQCENPEECPE